MKPSLGPFLQFLQSFGIPSLDDNLFPYPIVYFHRRYWLLPSSLEIYKTIKREPYYLGALLGEMKQKQFFPSLFLLHLLAKRTPYRTMVKEKTAWLFTCKRDVMKEGILYMKVNNQGYTIVVDQQGNALGLAKKSTKKKVVLENVFDIGDYLRRER